MLVAAACGGLLIAGQSDNCATAQTPPATELSAASSGTPSTANPWAASPFPVRDADARSVDVAGDRVWLGTFDDQVCVLADNRHEPGHFGTCAPVGAAAANGLFSISRPAPAVVEGRGLPAGTSEIVGVVPDGVLAVTLHFEDGARIDHAVTSNVVRAEHSAVPRSYEYRDASGAKHHADLGAPS